MAGKKSASNTVQIACFFICSDLTYRGRVWWKGSHGFRSRTVANSLRPRQNGRHFPDDILKCIFLNENIWISLTISLKCVRKVRINNIPSLVQIMAWRRPGDKLLSEPMMVSLLTHICVTRPQWVNFLWPRGPCSTLVQVMICCLKAPSHLLILTWMISIVKFYLNFTHLNS